MRRTLAWRDVFVEHENACIGLECARNWRNIYSSAIYVRPEQSREPLTQHHAVCCQALEQGWGRPLRTQWIDANRGYRLLQQLHFRYSATEALKSLIARYGVPDTVVSDNGPQFASEKFTKFAKQWHFERITSSPQYPQTRPRMPLKQWNASSRNVENQANPNSYSLARLEKYPIGRNVYQPRSTFLG